MTDTSSDLRRALVEQLQRRGHLRDPRVAAAFAAVPRELFLPEVAARHGLAAVYRDEAIVVRRDVRTGAPTSSSSQPAIMAEMLEMLDVRPGARVLEIGAGTGYNAALLAHLAGPSGSVTSVELDREVASQAREHLLAAGSAARVVIGDGRGGIEDTGPFDRIVCTASTDAVPAAWYRQLVPGGLAVVPLRLSPVLAVVQAVVALRRVRDGFDTVALTGGGFIPLRADDQGGAPAGWGAPAQVTVFEPAGSVGGPGRDPPPAAAVDLTGPALAGLDAAGRGHLAVTALGFGREHAVDLAGAAPVSLEVYVALALPEERLVEGVRAGAVPTGDRAVGTVGAVDGSLAFLVVGGASARIVSYGGPAAERALTGAVARWVDAGRPALGQVSIAVRYGAERPHAWRTVRRAGQWIAFDWRPRPATASPGG